MDVYVDEQGIYREKPHSGGSSANGDQGILVDEEGIWRDEPTDQSSHYSLRTFHTDSGIGHGTGKSSSATLNQFRSENGSEEDYEPQGYIPTLVRESEDTAAKETSSQVDSKSTTSYHISELEHSESQQENISFEHQSYDSDQALEFPELADESYLFSDQSNARGRSNSHGDSDTKSVDFDKYVRASNYADVFHDLGQGQKFEGRVPKPYEQTAEEIAQAVMADDNLDQSVYSSEGEEVSDIEENYDNFQPNADFSRFHDPNVLPHVSKAVSKRTKKRLIASDQESDVDGKQPLIVGDSIFTQEEFSNNRQSLAEFEQMEAALEGSVSENEAADNQLDLIGAYLKGLQESDDDIEIDEEIAYHSEKDQRVRKSRGRGHLHAPAERKHHASPGSPRVYDTEQNGYSHQQDSISMISGSVDEIMLEPHLHDDGAYSDSREADLDKVGALPTLAEVPRPPSQSRIPILRSGSPSRSRPGSRSNGSRSASRSASRGPGSRPTSRGPNSRSGSPDRKLYGPSQTGIPGPTAGSMKGPRRALPLTPQKRCQDTSPSSGGEDRSPRHFSDAMPSARSEKSRTNETTAGNQMSQPESEMGRATKWLLMDDDDLHNKMTSSKHAYLDEEQDRVPSLTLHPSPRSKSNTPNKTQRDRSPVKESSPELRVSTDESGGEDLSQGSTASKRELKTRYIEEVNSRKQNEETMNQLQKEYQNLLKKYAQAENVIDDLRLGAKVNLYMEGPPAGIAMPGTMNGSQGAKTFPLGVMGHGTQGRMTPTQMAHHAIVGSLQQSGVRPPSRSSHSSSVGMHSENSQTSSQPSANQGSAWNSAQNQGSSNVPGTRSDMHTAMSNDDLESLQGDGVKLSLLVKAKAIEEQTNAFQILLDEKQLTLEDQSKALDNIKANYENLTQEYRNAKEAHDYRRRQGVAGEGASEPAFDETKEVDGELYQINMRLDDLEHSVQENLKHKSARKPFSGKTGPLKGDHSINTDAATRMKPGTSADDVIENSPSVGSLVGGASVDRKLHALHKEYADLMDLYRRMKGIKQSPERDRQLESLLDKLKEVYERTPEHRRAALPPELENQYSSAAGSFVASDKLTRAGEHASRTGPPPYAHTSKRAAGDDAVTSERDSDDVESRADRGTRASGRPPVSPRSRTAKSYPYTHNERYGPGHTRPDRLSSDSTAVSDVTGSTAKRLLYGTESESDAPRQSRTRGRFGSDSTPRRLPRTGPGPRSRGRELPITGKDGYGVTSASGGSRGMPTGVGGGSRNLPANPSSKTSGMACQMSPRSRSRSEDGLSDSVSSSGSADSVIYNARRRSGSREKMPDSDLGLRAKSNSSREREPISGSRGQRSRQGLGSRSRSRGRPQDQTTSDDYSEDKPSPRSDKLRSLTDEVERLKQQINPGRAQHIATETGAYNPQFAQNMQAPPSSQIVPPLTLTQPQTNAYANQAVNYSQVPPGYANQPVSQAQMPPTYGVNQSQVPPIYANQVPAPMYQTLANPYPAPYNGYDDPQAQMYEYYDEYPEDGADLYYQDGDEYEPRYNKHRSNSVDGRDRRVQSGSRERHRYGTPSRELDRARDYDESDPEYDSRSRPGYSRRFKDGSSGDRNMDSRYRHSSLGGARHASADRYAGRSRDGSAHVYSRNRSHSRGRSRERIGHYSDPESPDKSPERVSEMRRYFVPRRASPNRRQPSPIRVQRRQGSPVRPPNSTYTQPAPYGQTYAQPQQPYYGAQPPVQHPHIGATPQSGIPGVSGPQIGVTPAVAQNGLPQAGAYVPSQDGSLYGGYTHNGAIPPHLLQGPGVANAYPNGGVTNGYQNGGSYHVNQTTDCPMCGGVSQHSHGEYQFLPQGVASQQTQQNNQSGGLVPVKIISGSQVQKAPKVRYYVREFGGESASEAEARVYRKTSRVKTYVLDDGTEDESRGRSMDDSLHEALQTANKLKCMSSRMRDSLNDEINRSIKEGSFLFAH